MNNTTRIWISAILVAGLGAWILFDAEPGINWGIWTLAAAGLLIGFVRSADRRPVIVMCAAATIIAFGGSVTGSEFILVLSVGSVILFLALAMLLSIDPRLERITAVFTIPAPIVAFVSVVAESGRRGMEALHVVRSNRTQSVVRGVAITLPVVVVFGLLLASADPLFATWRDTIGQILSDWTFLPRSIFFLGLLTIVLGAYGFAARETSVPVPIREVEHSRWLGSTEQLILLSSVTVLFWTFLAIQASYFFGNSPLISGSGVTFAEYARSGFGELTVVASLTVLLILGTDWFAKTDARRSAVRMVTLALIVAVIFLLASAFRRMSLYEEAYGFTTMRLDAQVYMAVVAVALGALAMEVFGEVSVSRLFRRIFTAATLAFVVIVYWNDDAWIANRNLDRVATTGKLDSSYLTRGLAIDAVPTLVDRLGALPEPLQTELRTSLELRYKGHPRILENRWFEWNASRQAARNALQNPPASRTVILPRP